jgi:predicted RNA binding protein YcfA (HicA-like mRNA interferase family)
MAKLPQLTAIQLAKIIAKFGFEFIRQEGSHMFFKHPDGRTTVMSRNLIVP